MLIEENKKDGILTGYFHLLITRLTAFNYYDHVEQVGQLYQINTEANRKANKFQGIHN
jgi:hypothetical protein